MKSFNDTSYAEMEISDLDSELEALKSVATALDKVSDDGKYRCIKWLVSRYMQSNPVAQFEMGMIVREKVDAGTIKELEEKIEEQRAEIKKFQSG